MNSNTKSICIISGMVSTFLLGSILGGLTVKCCINRRNRRLLLCDHAMKEENEKDDCLGDETFVEEVNSNE